MMRILLYGINYSPELTGRGKATGELAVWLHNAGHDVRVITAPPYYPEWKVGSGHKAWAYTQAWVDGVKIWRSPLWVPSQPDFRARMLHALSFAVASFPLLLRQLSWRPQVIFLVAPAFVCAPGAWFAARVCGAKAWLHVQDVDLDTAAELDPVRGPLSRRIAHALERWLLRRFDRVSATSANMVDRLIQKDVMPARVRFFPNWCDLRHFGRRAPGARNRYRQALFIAPDDVVALYSGTMGDKHALDILPQLAKRLKDQANLIFVFCGQGQARAHLEAECAGLANVFLLPLQPAARLPELLEMADVHLLPQRRNAADLVMPSKLAGMLASGRPVLASVAQGSSLAAMVTGRGIVVAPEDVEAMAMGLLRLMALPPLRKALGMQARKYAEQHLAAEAVLSAFQTELYALVDDELAPVPVRGELPHRRSHQINSPVKSPGNSPVNSPVNTATVQAPKRADQKPLTTQAQHGSDRRVDAAEPAAAARETASLVRQESVVASS